MLCIHLAPNRVYDIVCDVSIYVICSSSKDLEGWRPWEVWRVIQSEREGLESKDENFSFCRDCLRTVPCRINVHLIVFWDRLVIFNAFIYFFWILAFVFISHHKVLCSYRAFLHDHIFLLLILDHELIQSWILHHSEVWWVIKVLSDKNSILFVSLNIKACNNKFKAPVKLQFLFQRHLGNSIFVKEYFGDLKVLRSLQSCMHRHIHHRRK